VRAAQPAAEPVAPPGAWAARLEARPVAERGDGQTAQPPPAPVTGARAPAIAVREQAAPAPAIAVREQAAPVPAIAVREQAARAPAIAVRARRVAVTADRARAAPATAVPLLVKVPQGHGPTGATHLPELPAPPLGPPGPSPGENSRSAGRRSRPHHGPAVASRRTAAGTGRLPAGTAPPPHDAKVQALAVSRTEKASPTPAPYRARWVAPPQRAATCGPGRLAPRGRNRLAGRNGTSRAPVAERRGRGATRGSAPAGPLPPPLTRLHRPLGEARPARASLSAVGHAAWRPRPLAARRESAGSSEGTR
jgi:hypothetical protein